MIPDTLYDLALSFRKAKLWQKIYDSQLFAVRHSDGMVGYCCVMGSMGEHFALAEYPGDAGLDAYRRIGDGHSGMDVFEQHELMLAQDCLMVSFQNKGDLDKREVAEVNAYTAARGLTLRGRKAYPQFERFRPHYMPWRLDDEKDQEHLKEALEAALEVSERLTLCAPEEIGFTEGPPFDRSIPLLERENDGFAWDRIAFGPERPIAYASPEIKDDLALAKLAKCKKRSGEWACDIFIHLTAVSDEAVEDDLIDDLGSAPYFPYLLIIVDAQSGMVLGMEIGKDLDDATGFCNALVNTALNVGKPTRILVVNKRAQAFFKKLAAQMDAKLVLRKRIPVLAEAKEHLAQQFGEEDAESGEDFDEMMAVLSDPSAYRDMPDDVLTMLKQTAGLGALPDEVARLVARECKKRGM